MQLKMAQKQGNYTHIYIFSALLVGIAFAFDRPTAIGTGFIRILLSPSNLITDYIEVGGLGAAFLNSGIIALLSVLVLHLNRVKMSGVAIAGIITICGFAFFGKNIFNSLPITLGVYLYALLKKIPFREVAITSLFATALGPLVSVLSFGLGLTLWKGILAGYCAGIAIGFVIPPLADAFYSFHQGFNLYNIGFTAGIVGMFATGILRMFNLQVNSTLILSSGNNLALSIFLLSVCAVIFLLGLYYNGWSLKNYFKLLGYSGRLRTDFVEACGYGITLINMAFMGVASWTYIIVIGCSLNGATIGAVLTVMGFSAFGNHPRNTLPIFLGAFGASLLNIHEPSSTEAVIATLFGSTLAPIAGHFGALAGIFAGFVHVSMTMNVSYLHGGMNLYNNGFSGGFVAATLAPLYKAIAERYKSKQDNS